MRLWKQLHLLVLLAAAIGAAGAGAQDDAPALDIWGFMDVQMAGDDDWAGGDRFLLGQAEIDAEAEIAPHTATAVALAYDPDADAFGLGVALVEFRLWGRDDGHRFAHGWLQGSGLVVGQFDVPFGIDWMVYPSIDRKLLSGPLSVAGSHDGWNDVGAMFHAETERFNGVVYATNGLGREGGNADGESWAVEPDGAWGGRLGVVLREGVEIGGSLAQVTGVEDGSDMTLWGADVQAGLGGLQFKGEYVNHDVAAAPGAEWTNFGLYAQALYDFGGWYLVGRFDRFQAVDEGAGRLERFCYGGGLPLQDQAELRCEFQSAREGELPDTWALQLAVAF